MGNTTVAFAILVGEDPEKTAYTLKSVAAQEIDSQTTVKAILVHDDEGITEESVATMLAGAELDVSLQHVSLSDSHPQSRQISMMATAGASIPEDVDWVWTLANDATLYSKNSLQKIVTLLQMPALAHISFVHACLESKSYDTGYSKMSNLEELCNSHGYWEVLGTPSSLVLAAGQFRRCFGKHLADIALQAQSGDIRITPYTHCQLAYLGLAHEEGLVVDSKLVSQDKSLQLLPGAQGSESAQLFDIAGEAIELAQIAELESWAVDFFRYGQRTIWTELLAQQGELVKNLEPGIPEKDTRVIEFIDNWQVILTLGDLVDDGDARMIIRNLVTNGIKYTLELLNGDDRSIEKLEKFFGNLLKEDVIYPSTLLRPDHMMRLMKKSA
tara:strand:+ start:209 stop:1363 length:1155 start_codon:yes stop_codon:yes gene_type:complete